MNASQRTAFLGVILTILLIASVFSLMGVTPAQLGIGSLSVKISSSDMNVPVYYSDSARNQQVPAFYLNDNSGPFLATAITQDGRLTLIEIAEVRVGDETLYNNSFWVQTQNLSVWNDGAWRHMSGEVDRDLGLRVIN